VKNIPDNSFVSHLDEFRSLLIHGVVIVLSSCALVFLFAPSVMRLLISPSMRALASISGNQFQLRSISPSDSFLVSVKFSFLIALLLASPFLLTLTLKYMSPALSKGELASLVIGSMSCLLLSLFGAYYANNLVMPSLLTFFWNYSLRFGVEPFWTITGVFDLYAGVLFAFVVSFQLPVFILASFKFGIMDLSRFIKMRRVLIVIIFIVSALLSPPDIASQIFLALPLIAMMELTIITAKFFKF